VLRFIAVQPAQKRVVGTPFHGQIPNQFSYEILAVKTAFAGAPVDTNFLVFVF
jgi:hypothetical protein